MDMKLRQSAEERLAKGTAPPTRGAPAGTNALTLLHGLASHPETAGDALKLLHELQMYQVELDLQHEQVEQECRQLAEDLTSCTALFDLAPFAYLSLDAEGLVIAANRIAADWLGPRAIVGRTPRRRPAGARMPRGGSRHARRAAQGRGPASLRGAIQGRRCPRARRGHSNARLRAGVDGLCARRAWPVAAQHGSSGSAGR
ncbi:MAG: PAS domain-containing protein [Hydrogenophaga sp.]|jgi:PAS domain-containing protein